MNLIAKLMYKERVFGYRILDNLNVVKDYDIDTYESFKIENKIDSYYENNVGIINYKSYEVENNKFVVIGKDNSNNFIICDCEGQIEHIDEEKLFELTLEEKVANTAVFGMEVRFINDTDIDFSDSIKKDKIINDEKVRSDVMKTMGVSVLFETDEFNNLVKYNGNEKDVVIPSYITGRVKSNAFYKIDEIESIDFNKCSVISSKAVMYCSNIKEITVDRRYIKKVEDDAFRVKNLKSIVIRNVVREESIEDFFSNKAVTVTGNKINVKIKCSSKLRCASFIDYNSSKMNILRIILK